jgi:DUF177 domain-containing protein
MTIKKNDGELKIRISQLSNGLHEYHFNGNPTEIGLEGSFTKPVEVNAVLDKTPHQFYLKVDVKTSGLFQCDRCIEVFEQPLSNHYDMFYVFDELETGKYQPEEVQVISPDTTHIDLADDVRQMVMLSVPLKLLCKETCKGLCPRCGTNCNYHSCNCKVEGEELPFTHLKDLLNN